MDIPVFVISLNRSNERRQHTTRQLNVLGVPFQIAEAVDGADISDSETQNSPDYGIYKCGVHARYLFREEIGCVLSHLKIFRKITDDKIEVACILEDDNDYSGDFKNLLENENILNGKWDILFLGHHSGFTKGEARSRNKVRLNSLNYFIGEAIEVPFGSYAYLINRKAAEKLLEKAYPVKTPFDTFLGNATAYGINSWLLTPSCATNSSIFKSTIYTDQKIIYSTPLREWIGEAVSKIYFRFPFLRLIRRKIYAIKHLLLCYLRRNGIIKNRYVNI